MFSSVAAAPPAASLGPSFRVIDVVQDGYATVQLYNFPSGVDLKVLMNHYGTLGIGGAQVAGYTTDGSNNTLRVEIASLVRGENRIAIRIEAPANGIYLSSWFVNNPDGTNPSSGTTATTTTTTSTSTYGTGGPYTTTTTSGAYFEVSDVNSDGYVYLKLHGFPAGVDVKVYMNEAGGSREGATLVGGFVSDSAPVFRVELGAMIRGKSTGVIWVEVPSRSMSVAGTFSNVEGATATSSGAATTTTTTVYGTGGPYTSYVPTFSIVSVTTNSSVTIRTYNFPANDSFDVLMNNFGTLGIGGTVVASISTGSGGSQDYTFDIPSGLQGQSLIALRLQSPSSGYYSYNWFTNSSSTYGTGGPYTTTSTTTTTSTVPALAPGVIPLITVSSVSQNNTVTIQVSNLPANDTYNVYMNVFGSAGIGGTDVGSISTGSGGTQSFTYSIPSGLQGRDRLAIRIQSPVSGYFSYNWFWNSTYP
jgi:hypothetical protein